MAKIGPASHPKHERSRKQVQEEQVELAAHWMLQAFHDSIRYPKCTRWLLNLDMTIKFLCGPRGDTEESPNTYKRSQLNHAIRIDGVANLCPLLRAKAKCGKSRSMTPVLPEPIDRPRDQPMTDGRASVRAGCAFGNGLVMHKIYDNPPLHLFEYMRQATLNDLLSVVGARAHGAAWAMLVAAAKLASQPQLQCEASTAGRRGSPY